MPVTIKDVAAKAGVSTATVSKVMNGSYSISEETANRVRTIIEELHYHPNARAQNLAKQRTRQVLFITTLGVNTGFTNPHMFEIMCGLEHALGKKGFLLMVKDISPEAAPELLENLMGSQTIDAVVIHASVISRELDTLVNLSKIPHIVLGSPWFPSHFSWIDIDNKLAGEMAANYLLQCGYQSLAYIGGTAEDKISEHRLEGILSALKEYEVIVPKNYLQSGESDCDSGYKMALELLRNQDLPDAIICANNYLAFGCAKALADHNISVPNCIGLMSFDEYPLASIITPKLTVVNIDVYNMGIQAGTIIMNMMKNPNMNVQFYCTLPEVKVGESTRNIFSPGNLC